MDASPPPPHRPAQGAVITPPLVRGPLPPSKTTAEPSLGRPIAQQAQQPPATSVEDNAGAQFEAMEENAVEEIARKVNAMELSDAASVADRAGVQSAAVEGDEMEEMAMKVEAKEVNEANEAENGASILRRWDEMIEYAAEHSTKDMVMSNLVCEFFGFQPHPTSLTDLEADEESMRRIVADLALEEA